MSDKQLIENEYKVKVVESKKGEYKVRVDGNDPHVISIDQLEEDKGSLLNMIGIVLVVAIIIIGLVVFFNGKLNTLNDKAEALQEEVDSAVKEKLDSQSNLEDLKKQNNDLNNRLMELQEVNKALKDKLLAVEETDKKANTQVSEKHQGKQDVTEEEYYIIEKSKIPEANTEIPTVPSGDLEIPTVPSVN